MRPPRTCDGLTGVNNWRGRCNELESFLGYGFTWGDFYDYFTDAPRKTYDMFNGFIAVAGCRLAVEF